MGSRLARLGSIGAILLFTFGTLVPSASATPVCTDGYEGGPPLAVCGGRVFPEAENAVDYVQYLPDPATGFSEYVHGIEYLEILYPRWISVFNLRDYYETDEAVSMGPDNKRSFDETDAGDGYDIWVIKLTDHEVPDEGKETLFYSLSVHGDERGGLEGGLRAVEDLADMAENGGAIVDGYEGYESTTGEQPEFNSYEVKDVLAKEAVYFMDFNIDGWVKGDHFAPPATGVVTSGHLYTRGNWVGTDLNRQMPTVGYINTGRNPVYESEAYYGHKLMHEVADAGVGGQMAYGADIHGESQSRAFVDIMYPAGEFDSVKHRRLMAIAERTKSVIDETLYDGLANLLEDASNGDAGEGIEDSCVDTPSVPVPPHGQPSPVPPGPSSVPSRSACPPANSIPTKPARWGTVWDTLGYTDTGFLGDYMATELGVTGMDYEIAFNHADTRAHSRPWNYPMMENFINAGRGIISTALAYAMTEREDFADFQINTGGGRVGYLWNPDVVTDTDDNGPGRLPGPQANGIGQNGRPVEQRPYRATNMNFFEDEDAYVPGGFNKINAEDIAADPAYLDQVDSLVIADMTAPRGDYDTAAYFANLRAWVERGGNLVLTDRGLHVLAETGVVPAEAITDIKVYQPYSNLVDHDHLMVQGLRGNSRQLAEATLVGYGIGNNASPMSVVQKAAWEAAGGYTIGTTGNNAGSSDSGTQTSVGELALGDGLIRILGGGLPMPSEELDHRYGLKDYALSYSGLFIIENSLNHDAEGLGTVPVAELNSPGGVLTLLGALPVGIIAFIRRRGAGRKVA